MRPRIKRYEADNIPPWQTIYCSLILIMLVLFVMLVSYSVSDARKVSGLKSAFDGKGDGQSGKGRAKGTAEDSKNEAAQGRGWIADAERSLTKKGAIYGLQGDVILEKTRKGLKCKIKSDVLFGPGEDAVKSISYPYLDEMMMIAKEHKLSLRIEGHTDDVPIHNDAFLSNWELSTARSIQVLKYYLEKDVIPAERLSAAGFSQYRPLGPNDTPQGRAQNRRIEVILEPGDT